MIEPKPSDEISFKWAGQQAESRGDGAKTLTVGQDFSGDGLTRWL